MSWLILADDLTGAADAADAFARRGLGTTVGWGGARSPEDGVFAYDAASRGLNAEHAAALRRTLLASLSSPDRRLFLKIDSTLRGQFAAEIAATLDVLDRPLGILAPAFPDMGRTTEDGRVRVRGAPLEDTEIWRLEHSYPTADLVQVMASAGLRAVAVPLETVRSGQDRLTETLSEIAVSAAVAVCDAVCNDDLDRIAAAGAALARAPVWIGSGGLTAALARAVEAPARCVVPCASKAAGVLVVVGSMAAASRDAAERLVASGLARHAPVTASDLRNADPKPLEGLAEVLSDGRDVLVQLIPDGAPDLSQGVQLAETLAERLGHLAPHVGGLVVTGGETARALLNAMGVDGVRLAGGAEAGVTLGLTQGNCQVPVVTKAGAFGDDGVLVRAVERLRRINREGIVA